MRHLLLLLVTVAGLLHATAASATNPLIMDQFTADPTVRVFDGKLYMYPSHDIKAPPDYKGRPNWFVMEDYHVFSSENLTDWKDHGTIVSQTGVEWTNPTAYSMWAPECVYKDGKYYFYFPAAPKNGGGFRIGVAVSDTPHGPFKAEPTYIEGVSGIDPSVLIDKDGSAYLFYSLNRIFVARLKPNMREIEGTPQVIDNLPTKGLLEGPFVFERKGIYYLTYPHEETKGERLEYATSTSPMGPYKPAGVILDEAQSGCWTVHHSLVEFKDQWYLFYHDKDLSPAFDKNRSARADKLFFNADGSIRKVIPTLRGVGLVDAQSQIQVDRYSATSGQDIAVAFLDETNPHAGWKTSFNVPQSWVRFNQVDFGKGNHKAIQMRVNASGGAVLEIRLDNPDGPVVGRVTVGKGTGWKTASGTTRRIPAGVHDLIVTRAQGAAVEVDWVRFR
jgi:hypothetical protein